MSTPVTDPLEFLRRQFIARCRTELDQLRALAADDPEFGRIAHRLAGSAASFGFPQVSEAAAVVDDRIRHGPDPAPDEIQALIESLEKAIAGETQTERDQGLRPGA